MSNPVLAAQLYTVRDFCKTVEDFAASLKKIRAIGYTAVQISGIGPISDADVKRICDDNGLKIVITHIGYDKLWKEPDAVIAQHKLWDCKNVAIGAMPGQYRGSADSFKQFAKEASQVGEKLAAAGLTFSYHNHSFEFVRFGPKTGLDIVYEESDPRYLMAEIDTFWVQHGGSDPAAWIRKMKNRMPVVHFKDMVVEAEDWNVRQIMAEIGEGNLNWPEIIRACQDAGVEWYAVEQDVCQRDPFESLKISYQNLKAMGLS